MASGKDIQFVIVKYFLCLLSLLMIIGSFYVGIVSSKIIGGAQKMSSGKNPNRLRVLQLSFWWFITVMTLALQDFSALVGIVGAYKNSYELTLTYSLLSLGVFILNCVNPGLLPTIVGPLFVGIVMIVAFVFSRYLKSLQYNITSSKSKSST